MARLVVVVVAIPLWMAAMEVDPVAPKHSAMP